MDLPINYAESHWSVRKQAREQYVKNQLGNCHYCGNPLIGPPKVDVQKATINPRLFPKQFFKHPVHLHHCHKTEMTIGAVHARCNAYMWQYLGE